MSGHVDMVSYAELRVEDAVQTFYKSELQVEEAFCLDFPIWSLEIPSSKL